MAFSETHEGSESVAPNGGSPIHGPVSRVMQRGPAPGPSSSRSLSMRSRVTRDESSVQSGMGLYDMPQPNAPTRSLRAAGVPKLVVTESMVTEPHHMGAGAKLVLGAMHAASVKQVCVGSSSRSSLVPIPVLQSSFLGSRSGSPTPCPQ